MNKTLKIVIGLTMALALVVSGASIASAEGMGDTGAGVSMLQADLISLGYSIPAGATGYYGSQTSAAVSAFQAAYASEILAPLGLTAPTGYAGTLTKAKIAAVKAGPSSTSTTTYPAGCTSAVGYSPTTGQPCSATTTTTTVTSTLSGTDGTIDVVTELSQYSNEEVGEGETDVKILGLEVETSNDGDVEIKSMKLSFDYTSDGSDNLDDYVSTVKVWMGSSEVGSADAEDFSEGATGVWTKTVTLKSGTVVKADDTEKFYVTVDTASTLDSGDINDTTEWNVDVDNIRFVDGSGVVTTFNDAPLAAMDVPVNFAPFSSAADTDLKISLNNTPDTAIVIVDSEDSTDVVLLKGKIKLDGTSDAVINGFPVTLTTTGTASVVAATGNVTLKLGGEEFSMVPDVSGQSGTITFDTSDFAIDAGETVNFEVSAEINNIDGSTLVEGDSITASTTTTNVNFIDGENEEGDALTASELSGSALGETQELRTVGIQVTFVSEETDSTEGTSANDDIGVFTIKYKVTAIGGDVYVSDTDTATIGTSFSTVPSDQVLYTASAGGSATASGVTGTVTFATANGVTDSGITNGVKIDENASTTFTLEVTRVNTSTLLGAGTWKLELAGVSWATTDTATQNVYDFDLDSFETTPGLPLN